MINGITQPEFIAGLVRQGEDYDICAYCYDESVLIYVEDYEENKSYFRTLRRYEVGFWTGIPAYEEIEYCRDTKRIIHPPSTDSAFRDKSVLREFTESTRNEFIAKLEETMSGIRDILDRIIPSSPAVLE